MTGLRTRSPASPRSGAGSPPELFTDADTYVVDLTPAAVDPVRTLALAASLAIDVVLKQKDY